MYWGRNSLVRGAILRAERAYKVDHGAEGAVAIVHRRVQLLVGHLDRSGLFGGGSTVAWGGSGDLVRLHLVACGSEVGRHIVGVGQVSRWGREAQERTQAQGERSRPRSRRDLGGTEARGRASHYTHGRGVAVQAGRTAVHEARAHRCEYVRRDEAARGVRQAQAQASRRAGRRVARGFLRPSKTHRKRWPVT